jgi:hypothetical protein
MSQLDILIDRFLEDHRECTAGGGYAQITSEDIGLLYDIVRKLVDLKCDKDADGDLPVECKLINRRTHEPFHYMAVPHRSHFPNDELEVIPFTDMLQILLLNLSLASDRVNNEIRCEEIRDRT